MIEIISAVATLLGVSAKDLSKTVKEARERKAKLRVDKRREHEVLYANQKAITEVITGWYGNAGSTDLKQYSVLIDGTRLNTTIYTSEQYLDLSEDLREVAGALASDVPTDSVKQKTSTAVRSYVPEVIARLEEMGVKIWNAPLYRLMKASSDKHLSLTFSLTDFLSYRFTSGLLGDEVIDALIETKGSADDVLANAHTLLPIRRSIMPDVGYLDDYDSRICAGGIGVLLAIARGKPYNDFLITLQVRSSKVSDGRGQLAVIPKSFHQPVTDSDEEVSLYSTLLREMFEEVYGNSDVEKESHRLKHDWYIDEEPGVAYFQNHIGAYDLEATGFGLNAVAGHYDVGVLLAIRDTWYWDTFGKHIFPNWEPDKLILISSKDKEKIKEVLTGHSWANESMPHVVEGLVRLKQIDSAKVNLPDIQRVLGA